jgi:hypothetical protein
VYIRLTRKLADALNGLDLRAYRVGQVLNLTDPIAQMLVAERWAEEVVPFDLRATADERFNLDQSRKKKKNKKKS